jgi:hypothetical protein
MEQLGDGRWRVGDFSKVTRFRAKTARDGYGDGVFVNIKAHVNIVKLFHDLPPELWHWVDKGFAPHQLNPRLSGGQVIHHVYKNLAFDCYSIPQGTGSLQVDSHSAHISHPG